MKSGYFVRITMSMAVVLLLASSASAHSNHSHSAPKESRSVNERVETGSPECRYETVPSWCKLPEGRQSLGPTHGAIVLDEDGRIYCTMDSGEYGILIYHDDGTLAAQIAPGLSGIHGMCIRTEGDKQFLYAAHLRDSQILKLTLEGEVVWAMKGPPMESGKYDDPKKYKPTAVAVGPDGELFVADGYGTHWIHRFDADRNYLGSFGGRGSEDGQFQTCHGLAIDPRGEKPLLLVCDRENRRLQHYDLKGNFVATLTEDLRRPCSVSFVGDRVAVAELEGRVTILDKSNRPIAYLGDNPERSEWANYRVPEADWQPGIFTAPHGVAYDSEGNLFVMDWNATGRISRLNLLTK